MLTLIIVKHIYLIRHGETAWSLTGQHTGRTDIALTEHGETEARELASPLAHIQFSRVLVSPLLCARQTCELAGLQRGSEIEPDLAEWDYGDYEGRLSSDIRKERGMECLARRLSGRRKAKGRVHPHE